MHAEGKEHLGNWHFDQRREIHEDTEHHARQVSKQRVAAGNHLNPFRLNEETNNADKEDADHQQREDHRHEAPGFPQPLLHVPQLKAPRLWQQCKAQQRHGQRATGQSQRQPRFAGTQAEGGKGQRQPGQRQCQPGQAAEAAIHLPQAAPAGATDGEEQCNQQHTLQGQRFGTGRRVRRHPAVKQYLQTGGVGGWQRMLPQRGAEQIDLKGPGNQQRHQRANK